MNRKIFIMPSKCFDLIFLYVAKLIKLTVSEKPKTFHTLIVK